MLRWLLTSIVVVALAAGGFYLLVGAPHPVENPTPDAPDGSSPRARSKPPAKGQLHAAEPPAAAAAAAATAQPQREPLPPITAGAVPDIVIPEGRVTATDKQEVPVQYEKGGQLILIGTEITPEEASKLPPKLVFKARVADLWVQLLPGEKEQKRIPESEIRRVRVETRARDTERENTATEVREYRRMRPEEEIALDPANPDPQKVQVLREEHYFRRLQEGDEVKEGQLVGMIDPSLAIDDLAIRKAKLNASVADYDTSIKTRDEAKARFDTNSRLYYGHGGKVVSEEDLRGSKLTWQRYIYEVISKLQAIQVAGAELKQSQTTLEMHMLRSKIPGRIKVIYKNRGDAVKNLDPVLQVFDPNRLRIEALVEMQYVGMLREGQEVVVEPTRFIRPERLLRGHLQEITSVAVSSKNDIVSASEDRTVRVWDSKTRRQKLILAHPAPVRAVACSPAGSNWCLTGATDGVARLFDLDGGATTPAVELRGGHSGTINTVAFSPQGKWCATGGDDRAVCLWDVTSGNLLWRASGGQRNTSTEAGSGHRGAVTSLAFLSPNRLVSAGGDKTLLIWSLKEDGSRAGQPQIIDRRSGDVPALGVSPQEQCILFDYGRELRVLTVPDQQTVGVLQTPSGAMNFSTMAQFSPDGKLILTASGSEGRLQLWRAPTDKRRAFELCQLISPSATTTCGAFSPDGSFLVTGTRDRQVLLWKAPTAQEMAELTATVTFIEKALDSNSRQVRIWAELKEPQGLVPGSTATMVVYPK
jgi:WD40 repeat protein